MKIGDEVFVHGYIDEIRKDTVIIRNNGGYFGTIPSEVITGERRKETITMDIKSKEQLRLEYDNTVVIIDQLDDKIEELMQERSYYAEKQKELQYWLGEDL